MLEPRIAESLARGQQRIAITGASGWIGLATLELLASALGAAFAERVVCFGSTDRELILRDGTRIGQAPLSAIRSLPPAPTWVLHCAFLTKDRAETMDEAAYCAANRAIGDIVLSALDEMGTEALFLASSGAAAKAGDPAASPAMRLYGRLKQEDEERFAAWAMQQRKRCVIGRIFNITGPYINKHQAYAIASFILDGLNGRPIDVRAPRLVLRSYVAIRELMSLVFALLGAEETGVVRFDSGGEVLELAEIARVVASCIPQGAVERAPFSAAGVDSYHGDCAAYSGLLARHNITPVGLRRQVEETIDYLRAEQ